MTAEKEIRGKARPKIRVDGWVLIDKGPVLTSTAVVNKVRKFLSAQKAGHAGTLDPLATGLLPVALGEATKTIPYIVASDKTYEFTVHWGESRNTDDAQGRKTGESGKTPTNEEIDRELGKFLGEIKQTPPVFSAIKVEGQRAYDLARKGVALELAPRMVSIKTLRRIGDTENRETSFVMTCGKGTYVRSLARDLAVSMGTLGYISQIRRTQVGPFQVSDAISLEILDQLSHSARAQRAVQPVMTALVDIPALAITKAEAGRMRNGQSLRLPTSKEGLVRITEGNALVAMANVEVGVAKPIRVFKENRRK